MVKKIKTVPDTSTEEKIKAAARKVFTQKGYAGTRTRDIAEEANINLALLNYYFRSKEKLFEIVMREKEEQLFGVIAPSLNDTTSSVEAKIETIVASYIDMLLENPDLPLFVLSEIRNHPEQFSDRIQAGKLMRESYFVKQLMEKRPDISPIHFLMSMLGMILFPFIGSPIFIKSGGVLPEDFKVLMEERKRLIPLWVKAILKTK